MLLAGGHVAVGMHACAGTPCAGVRAPASARVSKGAGLRGDLRRLGLGGRRRASPSVPGASLRLSRASGTRSGDTEVWGPVQETGEDIAESSDLFKNKMAPETFACDPEDPTPDCDGGKFITPDGHVYRRPAQPLGWVMNAPIIFGKPVHWWFKWLLGGHRRPGLLLPLIAAAAIYVQHWWTVAICAIWFIGM